jgi:type IV pilus assembly protein PilV
MVILAIGLLALAGLQARLHLLQIESYQRAQALILLQDMTSRVVNNRYAAASYVTGAPLGTGAACPDGHGHAAGRLTPPSGATRSWVPAKRIPAAVRSAPWSAAGAASKPSAATSTC